MARRRPKAPDNKKAIGKPSICPTLYKVTTQPTSCEVTAKAPAISCWAKIIDKGNVLLTIAPKAAMVIAIIRCIFTASGISFPSF